jgi:adenine-specific DNA-methyltransferase
MERYVHQPMITYIGNKRKLVGVIEKVVKRLQPKTCVDAFSGSGVVSRTLLTSCDTLYVNDLERYCEVLSQCFLKTPTDPEREYIKKHLENMNACPGVEGFFSELYAPRDSSAIQEGERCFFTKENANRIDGMLAYIDAHVPPHLKSYCLGPLVVKVSIHTNTSGVFKGFHKGGWGGKGGHALERIMKKIEVECPVWLPESKEVVVHRKDACDFLDTLPQVDLIYIDPPYNQHPYGSNYFMLNLVCTNQRPDTISKVSGIPTNWNKSAYNYKRTIREVMERTIRVSTEKATHTLVSYNNEGFITPTEWEDLLEPYEYEKIEIEYNCYKGSRNLKDRKNKVTEFLFVISSPKSLKKYMKV